MFKNVSDDLNIREHLNSKISAESQVFTQRHVPSPSRTMLCRVNGIDMPSATTKQLWQSMTICSHSSRRVADKPDGVPVEQVRELISIVRTIDELEEMVEGLIRTPKSSLALQTREAAFRFSRRRI
jgi:hypothetical protein